MKTKLMQWWEYDCPECETSNTLPNPPFPTTHQCRECGKWWDVQKMREKGFIGLCSDRVPV